MKMKQEHYEYLRTHVGAVLSKIGVPITRRILWDSMYQAGLSDWICKELYPYLDDKHIDTALRQIGRGPLL